MYPPITYELANPKPRGVSIGTKVFLALTLSLIPFFWSLENRDNAYYLRLANEKANQAVLRYDKAKAKYLLADGNKDRILGEQRKIIDGLELELQDSKIATSNAEVTAGMAKETVAALEDCIQDLRANPKLLFDLVDGEVWSYKQIREGALWDMGGDVEMHKAEIANAYYDCIRSRCGYNAYITRTGKTTVNYVVNYLPETPVDRIVVYSGNKEGREMIASWKKSDGGIVTAGKRKQVSVMTEAEFVDGRNELTAYVKWTRTYEGVLYTSWERYQSRVTGYPSVKDASAWLEGLVTKGSIERGDESHKTVLGKIKLMSVSE
jgi:hypothetical protein